MEESIFDWSDSDIRDTSNDDLRPDFVRSPPSSPKSTGRSPCDFGSNIDQSQTNGEFIVHCIPICPEGASIDENHDVHVNVVWNLKDIWDYPDNGTLIVNFLGKEYGVYKAGIFMKKQQQYTIYGKGIPRGNSKDVFDVSKKGDIILHITILSE
jgi:hypothetical protein